MKVEQYGIYYINLDPTVGKEVQKKRPCLVLTATELNDVLGTAIIAPITSTNKNYQTRKEVKVGKTTGYMMLDQLRVIDEKRICNKVGTLKSDEAIDEIKIVLRGLFDID